MRMKHLIDQGNRKQGLREKHLENLEESSLNPIEVSSRWVVDDMRNRAGRALKKGSEWDEGSPSWKRRSQLHGEVAEICDMTATEERVGLNVALN